MTDTIEIRGRKVIGGPPMADDPLRRPVDEEERDHVGSLQQGRAVISRTVTPSLRYEAGKIAKPSCEALSRTRLSVLATTRSGIT